MIITDFVLYANSVDTPEKATACFRTDKGNLYSVTGFIDAIVDIKLEKYFDANDMAPPKETFDALKYTPGQVKLRNEIRDNYKL